MGPSTPPGGHRGRGAAEMSPVAGSSLLGSIRISGTRNLRNMFLNRPVSSAGRYAGRRGGRSATWSTVTVLVKLASLGHVSLIVGLGIACQWLKPERVASCGEKRLLRP